MAETINKQNIEAIFPLTTTQQGLLFHSLSSTFDQGFLNLQCDLKGSVEPAIFETAWNMMVQRHAILRTTIHWQKIEKPVQIVHKKKSIVFNLLDWSEYSSADIERKWEELLTENRTNGVDFNKGALLQVTLVQFAPKTYRLLWTNHHLLLDGWSSNIILKDVFTCYESLQLNTSPSLDVLPSYKSYLRWVGQNKPEKAEVFWSSYFEGLKKTQLFNLYSAINENQSTTIEHTLTEEETAQLKSFAKQTKVTLNTIVQGIWSLVLFRYFDVTDAVHGTTVSGRTSNFVNMELLTGMYSKVHPVRNFIDNDHITTAAWFEKIQKRQLKTSAFEYLDLEDIRSYIDKDFGVQLFDSLLIFENYPIIETNNGLISVSNFKSGVTSTYPVTLAILPGDKMHLELTVSVNSSHAEKADWLLQTFVAMVKLIISREVTLVSEVANKVDKYDNTDVPFNETSQDKQGSTYVSARNNIEKNIIDVWEEVFGKQDIGVHDNFFSLGGKSLIAVKIFAKLSEKHGIKLPPTTLLENPTIAEISKLLDSGNTSSATMEFMVPLRAKGAKAPLFCVHAGGGHVFFYNKLQKYLHAERPVYALQPSGIDGKNNLHNSIAEMTSDYLLEIKKIQPKGPYHILVYCFGTAVGIEMTRQLKATNEKAHIMVMDTMALQEKVTADRLVMRTKNFVKRFANNPLKTINTMVTDRIKRYFKPLWTNLTGNIHDKNLEELKQNLVTIYKKYEWHKFDGQIDLILTEKASKSLNNEIIGSWQNLTEEVAIIHIEGNHRTLFEEPDVRFVGDKLEECMAAYDTK